MFSGLPGRAVKFAPVTPHQPFSEIAIRSPIAVHARTFIDTCMELLSIDHISRCLHRLLLGKVYGVIMHSGNNTAGNSQNCHEQYEPGKEKNL